MAGPVPLDEVIRREGSLGDSEWHLVTARGSYLPMEDVLLRMQSVDGELVYQALRAFRTDSGDSLLVNRGWVRVGVSDGLCELIRRRNHERYGC